jgi:Fe2+ or Zn2+ uptake regulation protein
MVGGVKSVDELTELFRAQGLKVTPQRRSVFAVLAGASHHPTAEAVHAAVRTEMPTVSLRTVYQTLNDLASMGELAALDLGTGATRFDPNLAPHHHLVCEGCGRVEDLHTEFPGVALPSGDPSGFEVSSTEIVFRGRCGACATGAPVPADPPVPPNQPNQPTGGAQSHG